MKVNFYCIKFNWTDLDWIPNILYKEIVFKLLDVAFNHGCESSKVSCTWHSTFPRYHIGSLSRHHATKRRVHGTAWRSGWSMHCTKSTRREIFYRENHSNVWDNVSPSWVRIHSILQFALSSQLLKSHYSYEL